MARFHFGLSVYMLSRTEISTVPDGIASPGRKGISEGLTLQLSIQVSGRTRHSFQNGIDNTKHSDQSAIEVGERALKLDMSQAQDRPSERLLGSRVAESSDHEPSWKSSLSLENSPWIYDQSLCGNNMFPMSGYVAIAGECLRQSSESKLKSFSVKELSVSSAQDFKPDDKLEIHTKLRFQGGKIKEGEWCELAIASHASGRSIGLCTGLVAWHSADTAALEDITPNDKTQRPVSSDYWYDMIADRGLEYGNSQRGLTEISTHLVEKQASATVLPTPDAIDSVVHPVFIDHCLQVLMIAACKGQGRLLTDLPIVSSIQHLVVTNEAWAKLRVNVALVSGHIQDLTSKISVVNERGHPIISGETKSTLMPDLERQSDRKLFSFTNWETDATYQNMNQSLALFEPDLDSTVALERLALLYALRSEDRGAQTQPYTKTVLKKLAASRKGKFGLIPDVSRFAQCGPSSRNKLIQSLKAQISGTALSSLDVELEKCLTDSTPCSSSASERQVLLDQLHPLKRNDGTLCDSIRLLGHKTPKMKVLELGKGTKNITFELLKALQTQFGEPLHSSYLVASALPDVATTKQDGLQANSDLQTLVFDAEKSIEEQGLGKGSYQLIIITDFAAFASNAKAGAKILKQLIHPDGTLVLLEAVPEPEWSLVLRDYLSKDSANGSRVSKAKISLDDVYKALTEEGFAFDDQNGQGPFTTKVLARPRQAVPSASSEITLVGPGYHLPLIREVETIFGKHGIKCTRSTMDGEIPPNRDMMVFVDFDEPHLYNITEAELSRLVKLVSGMKGKMIWITPSAQVSCKNPNSSMILGLLRTMRSEFKKDITTVELDPKRTMNASLSESLLKIYSGLSRRAKSKDLDYDYEYAIVDGEIKIPRIQWTTAEAEYAELATRRDQHDSGTEDLGLTNVAGPAAVRFRSDRSYLLVGGLGGLGRMISTWMVENGARNLIFLSRSAKEGPETTPFFDELRTQGCTVTPFAGSVTSLPDVEAAVKQATAPIAGIIQMSAVMRDNLMSQMSFDEWQTSVQPKVEGTWNLHHATISANLDFFLLFSSICGITGQWGQGNYNSANSFLDAFVNYRHGQNLPASVCDIGFMGSIGMAVSGDALVKNLKKSGYYFLNERHLIDALTISLAHSRPEGDRMMHRSQLGLGIRSTEVMTSPKCRVAWKKDSRMTLSHHLKPMVG